LRQGEKGLEMKQFLSQAMEREKNYDWLGAVEFYEKALGLLHELDFLKLGEVRERIGYVFYRAAMQAERINQFRERMREAVANFEKAKEFYGRSSDTRKVSRMLRCDAMIAYVGYWLASEVHEKKRLLDDCWQLTKGALKAFEEVGDAWEYGKTYNLLSSTPYLRYVIEWDFQAREKTVKEALEHGERAITLLSGVGGPLELARAYVRTASYLSTLGWFFVPDLDEKDRFYSKALGNWQKANELSEETAFLELLSVFGGEIFVWTVDEILVRYEKALNCAEKTRDKYLIGTALDRLAYATFWKNVGTEDPDKRLEIAQRALQYAEDARHHFSTISYVSSRHGVLWTGAPYAEHYWMLATWQTDLSERRHLLEMAIKNGTDAIKLVESSGYPEVIFQAHHVMSKALGSMAQIETDLEERKKLLEKALEHRKGSIKISEQLYHCANWNRGVMWNYLADLKAELSNIEKDLDNRKNMLVEAISNKECCLQLCTKDTVYFEKKGEFSYFPVLGHYQYSYGDLLNRLHKLTSNNELLRKAIRVFEKTTGLFQKLNLVSRVAECYWKVAKGYNVLGEHLRAAENFILASNYYTSAAQKIPQLKVFYQDYALYMEAWSEIEKARHHHARQEYDVAKEHYEKAATIHTSLKQWSYLAPNYSAWSQIENAEDLSRKEQSQEAIQTFEQAANLFTDTKKCVQLRLSSIENLDEKTMATNLITAAELRCQYCSGRIYLEEAKILDKKGDHYSSSLSYGSAAQTFEQIAETLVSEQDRKELQLIITLSHAWQKMTRAEAEAAPLLYQEASQLFEEAKELSPNEQAKMLALGHSRFCRALEAGTKFADTRKAALYTIAIQHLESAANYYVKAGFQSASEYAKATELLFDAYVQMDNAKKETDPEKRAKLYAMAEKVLQRSAGSFVKAKHPEKREEALKLLKKVKEDRELALSLSEVLHAPPIVSTTTAFATPTPTHENAVGLERFEYADIQANLIIHQKELKVGENLDLEIELVNAGKGAALLTKIAEVIPEGFELAERLEKYRVEDSYLNMKGKRLDPLKTEEVRLVLKPKAQGTFPLKPRILYIDENGKYRSHEPEPITISVKELGIKGWIKGPEKQSSMKKKV
jgi:hypothetical protein